VPDLGQMRPLIWALKEIDPGGLHRHTPVDYELLSLCLESLRNRMPSDLKLHHINKYPS